MFLRISIILSLLLAQTSFASAGFFDAVSSWFKGGKTQSNPMISVLITHDQPGVLLEVRGNYKIYDPNTSSLMTVRTLGKKRMIEAKADGLKWGEEFPGIHQIKIATDSCHQPLLVNEVDYTGYIYVFDVGGSVSVVNELTIEDYLHLVLPHQISEGMPKEALAAMAISARTQAYYHVRYPKTPFWAVDAKQVGYHGGKVAVGEHPIHEAICQTRSMILSRTGAYEGKVTPFPTQWVDSMGEKPQQAAVASVFSRISIPDAEECARQGKDAASILLKAFPGSHIELIK